MFMKKHHCRLLLLICLLGTQPAVHAQDVVKAFLQKAQEAYSNSGPLSFRVQYRYANNDRPYDFIDSVSGEVQLHKRNFRFAIDGITTVTMEHYTIQVIESEKLLYVAGASPAGLINPVPAIDSAFGNVKGLQTKLTDDETTSTLDLTFPPGNLYKQMTLVMDKKTGFFQKARYHLYTESLVGSELINTPENPGPYQSSGIIEVLFSQYQTGKFDTSIFRPDQYFTRQDGNFETTGQFKDYRIFLASSNL